MPARPRARDLGLTLGALPTGPRNAITDVAQVRVGHGTLIRGENIRTGVTAILPHTGNLFRDKVPGAVVVGNGFGKLAGSTQVNELGEIETPILLTSTLSVWRVADALIEYMLMMPGNETVGSINPLIGETNDGGLNDVRGRHNGHDQVMAAIQSALQSPAGAEVQEGAVGAGTGTIAFGWKGGIGTASRRADGATVGVLVQSNFGGDLLIGGVPVGRLLRAAERAANPAFEEPAADGSILMVIATDAPVDARNLRRIASRAMWGLGRTGSIASNGSGDYAIAFSTDRTSKDLVSNAQISPLFQATIEATEEAIVNSLLRAETVTGNGRTVEAIPIDRLLQALKGYRAVK